MKDLDIERMIDRNKKDDVNDQVLYTPDERFLLQYQRRNVIASSSESANENQQLTLENHFRAFLTEEQKPKLEEKVRNILKGLEKKQQTYQMRRILLGISTKKIQQLETLKVKHELKTSVKKHQQQLMTAEERKGYT